MFEPMEPVFREYGVRPNDLIVSLGVSAAAVQYWKRGERRIRPELAIEIERKFGIPRHRLRADLWDPPASSKRAREVA